jgi:hypothetical protein
MSKLIFPIVVLVLMSQWLFASQIITNNFEEEERQVKSILRFEPVAAQTLTFNSNRLKLGMTRAEVEKSLGDQFRLLDQFDDVTLITSIGEDEIAVFGAARFEKDRLIWLSRYWGAFFGNDAIELATELFQALTIHDRVNGVFTTRQFNLDPHNNNYLRTDLDFGFRAITISVKDIFLFDETIFPVSIDEHIRIPEMMTVGLQALWLGTSKEDVIFQLEPFFVMEVINNSTMMAISPDGSKAWILYFKANKFVGISSSIATIYGKSSTRMALSICTIIESFNEQQLFIANPNFDYVDYKEGEVNRLILDFENKQIVFTIIRNSASECGILLQEQIQRK